MKLFSCLLFSFTYCCKLVSVMKQSELLNSLNSFKRCSRMVKCYIICKLMHRKQKRIVPFSCPKKPLILFSRFNLSGTKESMLFRLSSLLIVQNYFLKGEENTCLPSIVRQLSIITFKESRASSVLRLIILMSSLYITSEQLKSELHMIKEGFNLLKL